MSKHFLGSYKGKVIRLPTDYKSQIIKMAGAKLEAEEAIRIIEEERKGTQLGLYCPWRKYNVAAGKYFRFKQFNVIAGSSGAGKSFFLNMMEEAFANKALNGDIGDVIILHFGYEMSPVDELVRTISTRMSTSYSHIMSSSYDEKSDTYNKLTDPEFEAVKRHLDDLKTRPIIYAKHPGTLTQMYITVYEIANKYPNAKLIVTNDHTLLNKRTSQDKDELSLLANGVKTFMRIRDDFDANVIALSQLNGDIERTDRRTNKALHYPIRTDIHGSNQIYHGADMVTILHRPELLNIEGYGQDELNTRELLHVKVLKNRRGASYDLFFRVDFEKGRIAQAKKDDFIINFLG